MALACCVCFWRMLRIQVKAQLFCLILAQATHTKKIQIQVKAQLFCLILAQAMHTKKIQISRLSAKDEEHRKRVKVMFVTITNFKR